MRRVASWVLISIGAFLLTVAALCLVWVPGAVERTPLDVDSVTRLAGEAQISNGTGLDRTPVAATSITHADSELSTDDVVLFQSSSCLMRDPEGDAPLCVSAEDPQERLLTASTSSFATDRRTAVSVPDFAGLPAEAERREGLINKFPFHVEQKTYPFWDSYIDEVREAEFQGEEAIDGHNTYKFGYRVSDADMEIAKGVQGKYATDKTMWVDPLTGSIVDQREHQVRSNLDGSTFLDLDFAFTPDTVSANIESAKDNTSRLSLLTRIVPIGGGLLGVLALAVGVVLALAERRGSRSRPRA